jgi:hypothetical protein
MRVTLQMTVSQSVSLGIELPGLMTTFWLCSRHLLFGIAPNLIVTDPIIGECYKW